MPDSRAGTLDITFAF